MNWPIVAGIDGVGVAETVVDVDAELRVEDKELETLLLEERMLLDAVVLVELRVLDGATGTK